MNAKHRKATLQHACAATLAFAAILSAPVGLGQTGSVYVAEYSSGTIERFDLSTATDLGAFATGLQGAQGLTLDRAGNLYATVGGAPSASWGIERFTPDGVGSFFASTLPWHVPPYQLAVDSADNVYAAVNDGAEGDIVRFTPGGVGSLFATWPAAPNALVCDSAGNVYVSEFHEIEKFTPDGVGSFFASIPDNTDGLAFDSAGNLFASNWTDGTITKFTPGGVGSLFATTTSGRGTGALAFDSANNLYALNSLDGTIEKITPDGVDSVFADGLGTAYSLVIQEVPEPSTLALFSLGLAALLAFQLATPSGRKQTALNSTD
jgi:sugar lactone lactonase YvrE